MQLLIAIRNFYCNLYTYSAKWNKQKVTYVHRHIYASNEHTVAHICIGEHQAEQGGKVRHGRCSVALSTRRVSAATLLPVVPRLSWSKRAGPTLYSTGAIFATLKQVALLFLCFTFSSSLFVLTLFSFPSDLLLYLRSFFAFSFLVL